MELKKSKSDNNLIVINNYLDSFTKDFKKYFYYLKYNKKNKSKTIFNNGKEKSIQIQRSSNNNIFGKKSAFKTIHKNPNPIEFYYEFNDFIQGDDLGFKEKTIQIKNNLSKTERKTIKSKKKIKNIKKQDKRDIFWEKVKYYIDLKNERLNELTYRQRMKKLDNSNEENKSNKKLNRTPFLIYNQKRKPLYQYKNINENSLSKNFDDFYKYYQKEQNYKKKNIKLYQRKKFLNNSVDNIDKENEKYNKFYEEKMNWNKQKIDKINKERNKKKENEKILENSFSFKPAIDKNSIQLIQKRNDFINFIKNKTYSEKNYHKMMVNKKEIYQKYLATIRPYMSFYYEKNQPFYRRNNFSLIKRKKTIDIGMIHINKGNSIKISNTKNLDNTIHEKSLEKNKKTFINKNKLFNLFKPDKNDLNNDKEDKAISKNNKIRVNKNNIRQRFWWKKIAKINKLKNEEKKYDFNDLYKVNVRENSSWNKNYINQIISKSKDKNLFEDFLCQ